MEHMGLKVGEVASGGGVNQQTIRFCEREGLLPAPPRLTSGSRFIRRAQELGFSLVEIRDLLSLSGKGGAQQVRARTKTKIADIDEKIRTLQVMKDALTELADRCPGCGPLSECPILDALDAKGVLG
jgi:DNA-binding transcriptional MerR regulator